jgi:hypothetical protein
MLALEELINEAKRARPAIPVALIVGDGDCGRLSRQIPLMHEPSPPLSSLAGVPIYEDPGLPPGNYEVINNREELRLRLHLIKFGFTMTPGGSIKPANWWLPAMK